VAQSLEGSLLLPKLLSKSEDELGDLESYELLAKEGLLKTRQMSSSTGNLEAPATKIKTKKLGLKQHQQHQQHQQQQWQTQSKVVLRSFARIGESPVGQETAAPESRFPRHRSEPPDMYSRQPNREPELARQVSDPAIPIREPPSRFERPESEPAAARPRISPAIVKARPVGLHAAHTSTPSNLLRKSLAVSEFALTPITDDDQSMSPITQSTTKMTKAMQVGPRYPLSSLGRASLRRATSTFHLPITFTLLLMLLICPDVPCTLMPRLFAGLFCLPWNRQKFPPAAIMHLRL
jgi:hypothetical protein